MSEPWNVPITLNDAGTRAVVETKWGDSSERCQMIFAKQEDDSVLITTCSPDVPSIRLLRDHMVGLAYFFRQLTGG